MNVAPPPLKFWPHTADGVRVRPGMTLWLGVPGPGLYGPSVNVTRVRLGEAYSPFGACWCGRNPPMDLSIWFSTPEAAKAAASQPLGYRQCP